MHSYIPEVDPPRYGSAVRWLAVPAALALMDLGLHLYAVSELDSARTRAVSDTFLLVPLLASLAVPVALMTSMRRRHRRDRCTDPARTYRYSALVETMDGEHTRHSCTFSGADHDGFNAWMRQITQGGHDDAYVTRHEVTPSGTANPVALVPAA